MSSFEKARTRRRPRRGGMIAAEDLCRELGSDTFEHACREADRKAAGALERPPEKLSDAAVVAGDGAATEAVEAAR